MSRQFVDVLLDGSSIADNVTSFRLSRSRNQALDTLTLKLADFSLYSLFDFGLVPTTERLQVGTSTGTPKTDGSTVSTGVLTSAGSDFTAEGVTLNDLIYIIASTVIADLGGHPITAVGTTTVTSSFTFGTATGIEFIILKNQGKFFVEKPDVVENKEDIAIPSLWGRCGLARLTDPFANRLTKTFLNKQNFSDLIADLVKDAGMDESLITIDINDFIVPGNLLTISNRFPLDIIINLANKTNGYVRCDKGGNLHIKKDIFHFAAEPIAETIGDDEIRLFRERTNFPEFGNRVLVRSVTPEAAQDVQISLTLETACIRGDGRLSVPAQAVVTDIRGNAIANGTRVDWTVDDFTLFTVIQRTTFTKDVVQTAEEKRANSLLTVSTDLPIREVIGVYLKMDRRRLTNFFTGGSFTGRQITLGRELPFSNTLVSVDYIASGIATNSVRSIAGAAEGATTFVSAAVGRIRDSVSVCIRNTRNIFLTLDADPSEFNVCLDGAHTGNVTARVRDNGETGQLIGIRWSLVGLGSISTTFTIVRDTLIPSEFTTSRNIFTVNTRYDISSVIGVFRAEEGKSSTNLFTNASQRTGSFDGREITLGTNLPFQRERVEIEYIAKGVSRIIYNAPTGQTAPSVVQVIAFIDDGTQRGIEESEEILLTFRCPDEDGNIAGVDPVTGLPTERVQKEPECESSTAAAKSCDILDPGLNVFIECVCGFLTGGNDCPTTEEGCRAMCQADYNLNGKSSLLCDVETATEFCKRETGLISIAANQECLAEHNAATVDRCVERCLNHEQDVELEVSPAEGTINCLGSKEVSFSAVGGTPPYSWSVTTGTVLPFGPDFENVLIIPPISSIVAGIAYRKTWGHCTAGLGPTNCSGGGNNAVSSNQPFGCNDEIEASCNANAHISTDFCITFNYTGCSGGGPGNDILWCFNTVFSASVFCSDNDDADLLDICDERSGAMILAGCAPCGLVMEGSVVTLTDAGGNTAMATIIAKSF